MTSLVVSSVVSTAVLIASVVADPAAAPSGFSRTLTDLHDGRFDAAQATLDAVPDAAAGPEVLFFRSFVTYWRLLYDDDNPALRQRLGRQLEAAIASAEAARQRDPSATLWDGNARLLLSQLRAIEKKPFAAAREAKRARKNLTAIDPHDVLATEALFGIGTYNYMADRVPTFVKGLRSLLFIPAGDRQLGLRQLDRAARESRLFAVEARLLLVAILANRHERLYDEALDHAAQARAAFPDALVVAHASAKLLASLARAEDAAVVLDRALARSHELDGVDPAVAGTLELLRARTDFARFRPDLAAGRAATLSASPDRLPAEIRDDARALAEASSALTARAWWPEAKALIGGNPGEAANGPTVPTTGSTERHAVMALLQGRAALAAGRPAEALPRLADAEASGGLPESWLGPCRLLAGQAADLQGLRPRALAFYKRAESTPGFASREAAMKYQSHPFKAGTE